MRLLLRPCSTGCTSILAPIGLFRFCSSQSRLVFSPSSGPAYLLRHISAPSRSQAMLSPHLPSGGVVTAQQDSVGRGLLRRISNKNSVSPERLHALTQPHVRPVQDRYPIADTYFKAGV